MLQRDTERSAYRPSHYHALRSLTPTDPPAIAGIMITAIKVIDAI